MGQSHSKQTVTNTMNSVTEIVSRTIMKDAQNCTQSANSTGTISFSDISHSNISNISITETLALDMTCLHQSIQSGELKSKIANNLSEAAQNALKGGGVMPSMSSTNGKQTIKNITNITNSISNVFDSSTLQNISSALQQSASITFDNISDSTIKNVSINQLSTAITHATSSNKTFQTAITNLNNELESHQANKVTSRTTPDPLSDVADAATDIAAGITDPGIGNVANAAADDADAAVDDVDAAANDADAAFSIMDPSSWMAGFKKYFKYIVIGVLVLCIIYIGYELYMAQQQRRMMNNAVGVAQNVGQQVAQNQMQNNSSQNNGQRTYR